jgi:hypothetical protein
VDMDELGDVCDNCQLDVNLDQRDTNQDGFGNSCDADYNDDDVVGISDFSAFRSSFTAQDPNPDVDFNGDGVVGVPDFNFFRERFGGSPGPSGYSCAGTIPCP